MPRLVFIGRSPPRLLQPAPRDRVERDGREEDCARDHELDRRAVPEQVDPVRHLLGSASAWGGNPDKEAVYLNVFPKENDGKTVYRMTVKDVPVEAFWSVCVYNAQGFFEKNATDSYVVNSLTATKNDDGSVSVQFGGEQGSAPNVIPVTPGWNYMVRLYRPKSEILDGIWKFPEAAPVK